MPTHGVAQPILLDFPDHFSTERLHLRAPRPGDGAVIYQAIQESLHTLQPWMPWANPAPRPEDSELYARRAAARFILREELNFLILRREDEVLAGATSLHSIDWSVPCFEIGYWLRASFEGLGYMTEAVGRLTAFTFEHLGAQRIEIRCDARNTRSAAVARRVGYTLDARLQREARAPDGTMRDTLVFAQLR
jgi:RimJ/RimL family protein N-acetyltransferase